MWSLHVLPVYAWVLSGYSGFLPPSKNMHVRLIGDSKLSLEVSVSVCGCLFRLSLCGPVMDWRPVQGVPRLSPDDRWDRLQLPRDPTDGLDGIENGWMDNDNWLISRFEGNPPGTVRHALLVPQVMHTLGFEQPGHSRGSWPTYWDCASRP